jgi:hypothetical protein
MCSGRNTRAAGRSIRADHDRSRHRSRRSAPSCTSARPQGGRAQLLFFGHQRSGYDFFYEDELAG